MGPVESLGFARDGVVVRVAGQSFSVSDSEGGAFNLGDYVVAAANETGAVEAIYHAGLPYVPGVTSVRVKGLVTAVDPAKGTLAVTDLIIDYTAQLSSDPTFAVNVGDTIEALGVQPTLGGSLVLATVALESDSLVLRPDYGDVAVTAARK
jgi:hypothetical protein